MPVDAAGKRGNGSEMKGIRISDAITVTDLARGSGEAGPFVVTNEATGRHFSANAATIRLIDQLRRHGNLGHAAFAAGITNDHAGRLIHQLIRSGIASAPRHEIAKDAPMQPFEGKLISVRFDLANVARLARKLGWIGHLLFSVPAVLVWVALVAYALSQLLGNPDAVSASLRQLSLSGPVGWIAFAGLYVATKIVHEAGHVLAYRVMSLREGMDPGPIRVGLMIFAATPFPYTDVTGSWRIASRWRRATIGAAGMYFESLAVAFLVLAWSRLDLGMLDPMILQVAVVSGAMTLLFNLNPAVKLDGYYILTDLTRQPNLAGRASQAARSLVSRIVGVDAPAPGSLEILYWVVSYVYRWTIFAGVFWLAYRFDPRLSSVVAVVALLLLVVRPVMATFRPLLNKASPMRLGLVVTALAAFGALAFIPFEARLLANGHLKQFRTEYVRAPEAAKLVDQGTDGASFLFEQPDLSHDILALTTRREVLENLTRRPGLEATELASLDSDIRGITNRLDDLSQRAARLSPAVSEAAVVTPMGSRVLLDQWVAPDAERPLAAVSRPADVHVTIAIPQNRLEPEMSEDLVVRLTGDPDCLFEARLVRPWADAIARSGSVEMEAKPIIEIPSCAAKLRNGASIVARLPLPPRSIVERLGRNVSRLLQERLPFEQEQ
ncbi:MAG: hypothetical protein AAFR35_15900 [Pseudomonadota bacterium]